MTAAYVYASRTASCAPSHLLCKLLSVPLIPATRLPVNHTLPSEASRKIQLQPGLQEYPSSILALWAFDIRLPIEGPAWGLLNPPRAFHRVTAFSVLLALLAAAGEHAAILLRDQRESQPLPHTHPFC